MWGMSGVTWFHWVTVPTVVRCLCACVCMRMMTAPWGQAAVVAKGQQAVDGVRVLLPMSHQGVVGPIGSEPGPGFFTVEITKHWQRGLGLKLVALQMFHGAEVRGCDRRLMHPGSEVDRAVTRARRDLVCCHGWVTGGVQRLVTAA